MDFDAGSPVRARLRQQNLTSKALEVPDRVFGVRQTVLARELLTDECVIQSYRDFLWSAGYGAQSYTEDFSKDLAYLKR
jgi:hypothetical protein